jgi:hypothetical protein
MQPYFVDGWFVAGPALLKRYDDERVDPWGTYSNRGGSAELALVLLRLDLVRHGKADIVGDNPVCYWQGPGRDARSVSGLQPSSRAIRTGAIVALART